MDNIVEIETSLKFEEIKFKFSARFPKYSPTLTQEFRTKEFNAKFHSVQNIVLISDSEAYSKEDITTILNAARNHILANYKTPICDNDLPFDMLLRLGDGMIRRYSLPSPDSKSSENLENDEHMYSFKVSPECIKIPLPKDNITITPLSVTEENLDDSMQQITKLIYYGPYKEKSNEENSSEGTNYPSFMSDWEFYLKSEKDAPNFMKRVITAPSVLYVARDKNDKVIGSVAISSTSDNELHYLHFWVVDKAYRDGKIFNDLLQTAIANASINNKGTPVFTLYSNNKQKMHQILERLAVSENEARLQNHKEITQVPLTASSNEWKLPEQLKQKHLETNFIN